MHGLLYDVVPGDPGATFLVAVLVITVGLAASYLPTRRATRVNPVAALQHE